MNLAEKSQVFFDYLVKEFKKKELPCQLDFKAKQGLHQREECEWKLTGPTCTLTLSLHQKARKPVFLDLSAVGDLIAHYIGYHESYRVLPVLGNLVTFSPRIKAQFHPFHHHWGVENAETLFHFIGDLKAKLNADHSMTFEDLQSNSSTESSEEEILTSHGTYSNDLIGGWKGVRGQRVKFLAKVLAYAIVYKNEKLQSVLDQLMEGSFFRWKAHLRASVIEKNWSVFASLFHDLDNKTASTAAGMARYTFFLLLHADKKSADQMLQTLNQSVDLCLLFRRTDIGLSINHIGQHQIQRLIHMIHLKFQASSQSTQAKEFWKKRAYNVQVIQDGHAQTLKRNAKQNENFDNYDAGLNLQKWNSFGKKGSNLQKFI